MRARGRGPRTSGLRTSPLAGALSTSERAFEKGFDPRPPTRPRPPARWIRTIDSYRAPSLLIPPVATLDQFFARLFRGRVGERGRTGLPIGFGMALRSRVDAGV